MPLPRNHAARVGLTTSDIPLAYRSYARLLARQERFLLSLEALGFSTEEQFATLAYAEQQALQTPATLIAVLDRLEREIAVTGLLPVQEAA